MNRSLYRVLATAAVAATAVMISAVPASAHVTALPGEVTAGSFATVTFRVPNESDTAATSKLVLEMPQNNTFAFTFVQPHPEWTHKVQRSSAEVGVGVQSVTWKAGSRPSRIAPGDFDEFKILTGPFAAGQVCFKAAQYYDDGTIVKWDEVPTAEVPNPAHPAPCITVVAAPAAGVAAPTSADAAGSAVIPARADVSDTRIVLASGAPAPNSDSRSMTMLVMAMLVMTGTGILIGRFSRRQAQKS